LSEPVSCKIFQFPNVMLAKWVQVLTLHSYDDVQINMSYCNVSDHVLCLLMSNLKRLQDAKLVCLTNVTVQGLELALRSCCGRIKKVKLQSSLRFSISSEIVETFHARGCKIRWD
jgi:F-box/leucine-rich repeat protein 2/20